jgi:cobalt/nickel transport system permease protein
MHLIDCYAHSNHWRKRHPGEKAVFALGLLLLALVLPWTGSLAAAAVAVGATLAGARIPWRIWMKVMAIPLVFLLPSALLLAVGVEPASPGFRIALAPDRLGASGRIVLRALSATACLNLLALTTPAYEWLPLLRRCRVPEVVLDTMLLVYRMFFLLFERMTVMRTAQAARLGYADRRCALRSCGLLGSSLLTRSMDRAARMEACLEARGYTGELRVLPCASRPSRRFAGCVALAWSAVLAAGFMGRS